MGQNRLLLADYLEGQGTFGRNYIINPSGFKNVTRGITVSAGATVTRNTTTPLTAISDINISLTTASSFATFATNILDRSLSGQNCELVGDYTLTLGAGATVQAQVLINSVIVNTLTLPASATSQKISVNYPCGDLATATTVRFAQTVAATTSTLRVANVYLGAATNVGSVAQATMIGSATHATASNCFWTTTSTSFANFAADADCPTPTVTGSASAPATKVPGITFASLPPGDYQLFVYASFAPASGSPAAVQRYVVSDGSTVSGSSTSGVSGTANYATSNIVANFSYTATQTSRTFQVQGRTSDVSNAAAVANDLINYTGTPLTFVLYRFPTASEQVLRIGAPFVGWTSFPIALQGNTNSVAFTNQTTTAFAKCEGSTLKVIGNTLFSGTPGGGTGYYKYQLPAGWTIDTTKVGSSVSGDQSLGSASVRDSGTQFYRGVVRFGASTNVNILANDSSEASASVPMTWAVNDTLGFEFTVPVTADSPCASVPMPLVRNAVTTPSAGVEAVLRLNISGSSGVTNCTTASCTVETSNVPGATSARASAGTYTITWPAGTLSAKGSCSCSANSVGAGGPRVICSAYSTSATNVDVTTTREDTGAASDTYSQVQCTGPR